MGYTIYQQSFKGSDLVFYSFILFIIAGIAEIGGGYLIWLWLREGKPFYWAILGGITLVLYGVVPTFQTFPSFGRVYAAYGGIFIILSLIWGWAIDRKTPDFYDWIGAVVCIAGASIILFAPRH